MYKLDRARRYKVIFGVLALVFFCMFLLGYAGGGYETIMYGFMNEPLSSIIMVSSLFCAVVCLVGALVINALEKDIAEWLKILETKIKSGQQ